MNFSEIIFQAALFTVTFFIFNKIFNYFIFKNRRDVSLSFNKLFMMFSMYLILSTVTHYFTDRNGAAHATIIPATLQSGQSVAVTATSQDLQAPLNTTFDLSPVQDDQDPIVVTTDLAKYNFSLKYATLQSIDAAWNAKKVSLISNNVQNFVIAIDETIPNNFALISNEQTGRATREVIFKAPVHSNNRYGTLEKKFIIHEDSYQIDLEIHATDLAQDSVMRLLVPATADTNQLHAVVNTSNKAKLELSDIALNKSANFEQYSFEPAVYGFSSVYFSNICFAHSSLAMGRVYLRSMDAKQYQAVFETKKLSGDAVLSWSWYCGPNCQEFIQKVSPSLQGLVDYGFLGFIARPVAKLLDIFNDYTHNYGWAILLLALLFKIITLPLALRSQQSLKDQAEFEKKRLHLQQKYKHDKAALDQATAELISKHGLPMIIGCLPMLLNIPVFLALNKVLTRCIQLYGVSFLWIPDLSQADPYYILSLLTFVGMIFAPSPQVGPRQVMSKIGFALLLAAATSYLSAGLALFIVINTIFGIIQEPMMKYIRILFMR